MSGKIRRIVEIVFWGLLAVGNAAAVFLLWTRPVEDPPDDTYLLLLLDKNARNVAAVERNTVTLPDGSVFTAKLDGERKEVTLERNGRQIHCISDGPLWHCAGV